MFIQDQVKSEKYYLLYDGELDANQKCKHCTFFFKYNSHLCLIASYLDPEVLGTRQQHESESLHTKTPWGHKNQPGGQIHAHWSPYQGDVL